jgi:hypothetical protein
MEEIIFEWSLFETIGIIPYNFADDETFKRFHNLDADEEVAKDDTYMNEAEA